MAGKERLSVATMRKQEMQTFELESQAGYHVKCSPVGIVSLVVRVATATVAIELQDMH